MGIAAALDHIALHHIAVNCAFGALVTDPALNFFQNNPVPHNISTNAISIGPVSTTS
jgi:hypothetical protein